MYIHKAIEGLAATRSIPHTARKLGVGVGELLSRLQGMSAEESAELAEALSSPGQGLSA